VWQLQRRLRRRPEEHAGNHTAHGHLGRSLRGHNGDGGDEDLDDEIHEHLLDELELQRNRRRRTSPFLQRKLQWRWLCRNPRWRRDGCRRRLQRNGRRLL
jgi:hypothetical protein